MVPSAESSAQKEVVLQLDSALRCAVDKPIIQLAVCSLTRCT
jgi:hypothetical protein